MALPFLAIENTICKHVEYSRKLKTEQGYNANIVYLGFILYACLQFTFENKICVGYLFVYLKTVNRYVLYTYPHVLNLLDKCAYSKHGQQSAILHS